MAAADAIVLPFRDGGGEWNSSLQAARLQGTPVVTTSRLRSGFDADENTAYCAPGDIEAMRRALQAHAGRRPAHRISENRTWEDIAAAHRGVYRRAAHAS
jgi:hypothetical protein